jgi:hypothetical protein
MADDEWSSPSVYSNGKTKATMVITGVHQNKGARDRWTKQGNYSERSLSVNARLKSQPGDDLAF